MPADDLDEATMRYMQSRAADLIVVSRPVLLPNPDAQLRRIEGSGLWGWRTPVMVC
jgi:hypothetical protein